MPKKRKSERVRCAHFTWLLVNRRGQWYGDGRSNTPSVGRHSLGTTDRDEALKLLPDLDRSCAEQLGLVPPSENRTHVNPLGLEEGRRLYEGHIARSRVTGGVRESTRKRYRAVFDKFLPYLASLAITVWNAVTADTLNKYAAYLETRGYSHVTIFKELVTIKQAIKSLIQSGHLKGMKPIELSLRKADSDRPYCWKSCEVRAMLEFCREKADLKWIGEVIVALACTGLRIAELVSLRWADVDLQNERLSLTDETAHKEVEGRSRRQLKSGRSRLFPIHPDLLAVLRSMPRVDRFVFHGPRGGRLKPDTVRCILIREVIEPLAERFPSSGDEKGFRDGRLHSFRHYFCSTCANRGVPERMVMDWLGHADSGMVRHYYHMNDEEARRRMADLDFLGGAGGRSAGVVPPTSVSETREVVAPELDDPCDA